MSRPDVRDKLSTNFWRHEFACRCGCGFDTVDVRLLEILEAVRQHFDARVDINSGCRCVPHNLRESQSPRSQHLYGRAADIVVDGVPADLVADYLEKTFGDEIGLGRYLGRTHVDSRGYAARWDERPAEIARHQADPRFQQ